MDELQRALGLQPEHEYGPRDPTRWTQPRSVPLVRALTALGALIVGFLVSTGLLAGREAALATDARKDELVALVEARQARAEDLSVQLDGLRDRVEVAEQAATPAVADGLAAALARAEAQTGLTPLAGPGLRVTFSDGATACSTGRPEDCRIQDVDLQLAANTLFGAGAEGVAINSERLIATTAIRSAGSSILVNYRVLTSPYVVEAVGDAERLSAGFAASQLASDFAVWQDAYSLGFEVETIAEALLPGYDGAVRVRVAEPADALAGETVPGPRAGGGG